MCIKTYNGWYNNFIKHYTIAGAVREAIQSAFLDKVSQFGVSASRALPTRAPSLVFIAH